MTQEWIFKTLIELGFKQEDAEIYFLLIEAGPRKASEISDISKIYKRKVYRILEKLEKNKLIETKITKLTIFQAVPFDNFLDSIIRNRRAEACQLEERKAGYFARWRSIIEKDKEIANNT